MIKKADMLRSESDSNFHWNLSDIFANEEAYNLAYDNLSKCVEAFGRYNGIVEKNLLEVLKDYFGLGLDMSKLYAYAKMKLDQDTTNTQSQSMYGKVYSLYIAFSTATSFLTPEILTINEEVLIDRINNKDYADYSSYLKSVLRDKPHTLSLKEEKLLAMSGDVASTAGDVYSMLTDADMQFPEVTDIDGKRTKLNESYYSTLIQCQNRDVRKEAFKALFETYSSFKNTFAATYSGNIKKDKFNADVRGFSSCVEATLFQDELPISVYDNLVSVINSSIPYLDDYLRIRKDVLKLSELELYDLYVPMLSEVNMEMPYDKAYNTVINGLSILGDDYLSTLKKAKKESWIDVYSNKGKTSGAYSFGVYGVHPFILLNHNDDLHSCMTLAHELGHTMHSWYSNNKQAYSNSEYSIFVAEVASTVNEVLLIRHLLNNTNDKQVKAYLLNYFLEQFRTTVFRQTMFAEFERKSHSILECGEVLTHEALSKEYLDLNKKYYGNVCNIDKIIECEWMRIPHFYHSFYVFVYATGFSAAVFLASKILKEGEAAVSDYKKFLSAGSSVSPLDALKLAGVDMEKPDAIIEAMQVFKNCIVELKELV